MSKQKLTEEELNYTLEFANALYNGYGIYNPFNQNNNLLNLGGKSSKFTKSELIKALESSPYDYKKLAEYSSFYETFDAIYAKTLRYYSGLLSFDLEYQCINIKNPSEYASEQYKQDLQRVWKFLDKFDYKQEFKKCLDIMLRRDICYVWFRDSENIDTTIDIEETKKSRKFALQIMPQDFCTITGYFNNSQLLYDIDMSYFLQQNIDINLFAPQIKSMLREIYKDNTYKNNTSLARKGCYANYCQCSPLDGAYAFKFDNSTFAQRPPFVSLLKSCLSNDEIEKMQYDKNMLSAWSIISGEIPLLSDTKVTKSDQFAINPKTMAGLMSLVESGIKGNIKPIVMPAKNIRNSSFDDQNPSMFKNQLKSSAGQGASASDLIYSDSNLSQFAMQNAILTDYSYIKKVYSQFSQFLNFYINKKTVKYKFDFVLDGLDREWWRDTKLTNIMKLSDKGLTLPSQYFASAMGYKPQNFARALEEARYGGMVDNLTLLLNVNTTKDGNSLSGRPEKQGLEKSDNTEQANDYIN